MRRALAGVDVRDLDPFVHMDQMGEVDYGPSEPKGTPWHPHRGFETVSYMIDGVMEHQDPREAVGSSPTAPPSDDRRPGHPAHRDPARGPGGQRFHGIQLWVNLPAKDKMLTPRYQNLEGGDVTLLGPDDFGTTGQLGYSGPDPWHFATGQEASADLPLPASSISRSG